MILAPEEKSQGRLDGEREASPTRAYQRSPSPAFPVEKAPPPIRLEYHPEASSSSYRAPNYPPPFDNNNAPPPSYYADASANPASSSHFAPSSSTSNAAMSVPLAPPARGSPPSFARPPSREVTYPTFPPMLLVATGKSLSKGFPFTSPASDTRPHPFTSHDIFEVDWMSFLQHVQMVGALSPKQVELSEHLPILSILPIVKHLASYGAQQVMKNQNVSKVVGCIDNWNRNFFERRKMRIILMKGTARVSGQNEYQSDNPSSSRSSESSSSTSKIEADQKYFDHPPPSNPSISQILAGVDDDVYRLFIVPLS